MKKYGLLFAAALLCASSVSILHAAEKKWTLQGWLKNVQERFSRSKDRYKSELTASAAVRGAAPESSTPHLYWKGKKEEEKVTEEELKSFEAALSKAQDGKTADAEKAFGDFLEKYPDSAMSDDAKQTLAMLKEAAGKPDEKAEGMKKDEKMEMKKGKESKK